MAVEITAEACNMALKCELGVCLFVFFMFKRSRSSRTFQLLTFYCDSMLLKYHSTVKILYYTLRFYAIVIWIISAVFMEFMVQSAGCRIVQMLLCLDHLSFVTTVHVEWIKLVELRWRSLWLIDGWHDSHYKPFLVGALSFLIPLILPSNSRTKSCEDERGKKMVRQTGENTFTYIQTQVKILLFVYFLCSEVIKSMSFSQ